MKSLNFTVIELNKSVTFSKIRTVSWPAFSTEYFSKKYRKLVNSACK